MKAELRKLTGWCLANKLSINYSKSKFMIFKPRQKTLDFDGLRFEINNCTIERVNETIFLGVVLDEHLNWKAYYYNISNVARKIAKSIGIIFKSRFCLSLSSLRTLYYSLSIFYVLCFCMGINLSNQFKSYYYSPKRVVRIISNQSFDAHSTSVQRIENIAFY